MYCKHCGEPPLNRTVYCKKCGEKLPNGMVAHAMRALPERQSGVHLQQSGVFLFVGYLCFCLFLLIDNYPGTSRFWPISGLGSLSDFNGDELIFFLIIGAILFAIANFYGSNRYPRNDEYAQMYDFSYKQQSTLLWFGIFMYALQIMFALSRLNSGRAEGKNADDIKFLIALASIACRIIAAIAAYQEAKRLNRETTGWVVFAIISPSMALLFLSQKNKLRD